MVSGSRWVVPPQMISRVLSCMTDPTDVVSVFSQETVSSSIQYPIDNVDEMENVGWACGFECFGPSAQIQAPELMEIKAEELRAAVCATPGLLQDASFSVEQWVMRKAPRTFRIKLSNAVRCGDSLGKPVGILHPSSGIPIICDVAPRTPPGQFAAPDLVAIGRDRHVIGHLRRYPRGVESSFGNAAYPPPARRKTELTVLGRAIGYFRMLNGG